MSNVRLRRLQSDYEKLGSFIKQHPRLTLIQADGDPPERYQLEYRIRSIRQVDDDVEWIKNHTVEILLPRNYPRVPPQCRMLTPIFHPNIAPHAICVGDHWSAGEPLWSIVARIGEIIAYQSYNTKSPLNGEAARWVDENKVQLPLDPVSMLPEEKASRSRKITRSAQSAKGKVKSTHVSEPATLSVPCTNCQARYNVPVDKAGKRFRCKRCQTLIQIPGQPVS
ncbi:Ubiquitin-conjugating enzyme [Symmachiella macrocystis]|uniref:Ubiquitin-conjugating enzyme n=1 Tax=Symmachiella macrocystis TaxID=2527985 RepID=A0A5C6AXC9_9PLAN|nr:ubiquitin-conjugating enzyme E2 [Symmachiella macrocystis]TWU04167.1 Ubiquitin-conjugating enzyme [Symmachiella macrocystis]